MAKRPRADDDDVPTEHLEPRRAGLPRVTRAFMIQACLQHMRAPLELQHAVALVLAAPDLRACRSPTLDVLEMFAGVSRLTQAASERGLVSLPYDVNRDRFWQNMLTPEGFVHAVLLCLQLKIGAFAHFGVPCSSWVLMNMATSGRTAARPQGHLRHESVRNANTLAARSALLVWLVAALGGSWSVEQPRSSLLYASAHFQELLRHPFPIIWPFPVLYFCPRDPCMTLDGRQGVGRGQAGRAREGGGLSCCMRPMRCPPGAARGMPCMCHVSFPPCANDHAVSMFLAAYLFVQAR